MLNKTIYAVVMLKTLSNECDLSKRQNERFESVVRISGDRELRIAGPQTENALLRKCVFIFMNM